MSKNWIQTYTGKQFFPMSPESSRFDIRDQARALSMLCRYVGHVSRFYSVAEHAVRVSRRVVAVSLQQGLAETDPITIERAKWGLIHDNSEAYLGDVSRPVKHLPEMAAYRDAERRLQAAIATWLELPPVEPPTVVQVDQEFLGTEVDQLKQPVHPMWASTTASGVALAQPIRGLILGWDPQKAEEIYLHRFRRLFGHGRFGL